MDWASSQWKEGLSSVALQKINALEEKIEKLQKERQQKQVQFECLEITLDKEKRKVEQEKQQTARLERELQSLGDTCKTLENKQQKLQNEISNRDARLNSLEGQLAQAKKQNCRLQQLENDIEDLRCLRDNSRLEQKELEERLKREQSTIIKQNDAISGLEQTIKTLQDKSVLSEKSFLSIAEKENINMSKSINDDSEYLRKKMIEQENTIKNLKEQLQNISSSKENMAPPMIITPRKSHSISAETPTKSSLSFWDGFGSTPAKTGNRAKHINESSTFDESDEKVRTLQLKLKQITQELECQRHNYEAAKNALEQRWKEKENCLKEEVKQQAQTISDLDKELKELKNKYQQDVVQANKKLDVVNVQLQKSELSKQQIEKEMKTLEQQISSKNSSLQQKDDELKELHKVKNSLETANKQMQLDKRQLEKNNSALQAEKNEWNEQMKDMKRQLEGSNNLVKEKELLMQNLKKEQDNLSRMNSELERKIEISNKKLADSQTDKSELEKQLKHLNNDIVSLNKNLENLTEEKKNACKMLDFEKSKCVKLEFELAESNKEKNSFQAKMKASDECIATIKAELEQLRIDSKTKIKQLENSLSSSNEENLRLKNLLEESSAKLKAQQEKLDKLQCENERVSNFLISANTEKEAADHMVSEMKSQMMVLQSDNEFKDASIVQMRKDNAEAAKKYEVQLQQMEDSLATSTKENLNLKNALKESGEKLNTMQSQLNELESENKRISSLVATANSEKEVVASQYGELMAKFTALKSDFEHKDDYIMQLETKITEAKEKHDVELHEVKFSLAASNEENTNLKNALKESTEKLNVVQLQLSELEKENNKISVFFESANSEIEVVTSRYNELKSRTIALQSDNESKDDNIIQLKKEIMEAKEKLDQVKQIEDSLAVSNEEKETLRNMLKESTEKMNSMQSKLNELELENNRILSLNESINSEKKAAESKVDELKSQLIALQFEIKSKDDSIVCLKKEMEEAKEKHDVQVKQFEDSMVLSNKETESLRNSLQESTKELNIMQSHLIELESENNRISSLIETVKSEKEAAESKVEELKSQLIALQSEIESKNDNIICLKKEIQDIENKHESQVKQLEDSLAVSNKEIGILTNSLKETTEQLNITQSQLNVVRLENSQFSSLIESANSEKEAAESKVEELKSQLISLQSEIEFKNNSINLKKEIEEAKEKHENEIQQLQNSLTSSDEEILRLKNMLEESSGKITELQRNQEQVPGEIERLSSLLSSVNIEKEAAESKIEEMKSNLMVLQSVIETKEASLAHHTKYTEDVKNLYEGQIQVLENTLSATNEENAKLIISLKEAAENFNATQSQLCELKTEKEAAESKVEELKSQLSALQQDIESKEARDVKIRKLEFSLTSLNEENVNLKRLLNEYNENAKLMQENLDKLDGENKTITDLLNSANAERESTESALQSDTELRKTNFIHLLTKMLEVKKQSNENIRQLEISLASSNEEITSLKNKLKEYADKITEFQENIDAVDCESAIMSDLYNSAISAKDAAELKIEEINSHLSEAQSDIECKERNLLNLKSELIKVKKTFDNIKSELISHVQDLTSGLVSIQECVQEISSQSVIMQKEISSMKDDDKMLKKEFSYDLLNHLNLIENYAEEIKDNYENKILELQESEESLNTEIDSLRLQLSEISSREINLKKSLEEKELKNQVINLENELKVKISDLSNELSFKNEKIISLESEIDVLKNITADEKSLLNTYLQDTTSKIASVVNSLREISPEISYLEENEKLNEACLSFEEKLSYLHTKLNELESEVLRKNQLCTKVQSEKENLLENLEIVQEKLNDKEVALENCYLTVNDQLTAIEILKTLNEGLVYEKNEIQGKISDLENKLAETESIAAVLKEEKSNIEEERGKLIEELELTKEKLFAKESELLAVKRRIATVKADLGSVITYNSCRLTDIDVLEAAQKQLIQENSELQVRICDLENKVVETESTASMLKDENNYLNNEAEKLKEELKLILEKLSLKESELEELLMIKDIHSNCFKNITALEEAEKKFIQEKNEFQVQISNLEKKVVETESMAATLKEENNYLQKEAGVLKEELQHNLEKLSLKESELEELSLIRNIHSDCSKDIKVLEEAQKNLVQERNELQSNLIVISQDINAAKEALSSICSETKAIFSLSKNVFHSVEEIEQQRKKVSNDLEKLKNNYCHSDTLSGHGKREVETLYDLILCCIELAEEFLANNRDMGVPASVTEITESYSSWTGNSEILKEKSFINEDECDFQTSLLEQRIMTALKQELGTIFIKVNNDINAFDEKILSEKDKFKFLIQHQLINPAVFKKMLVALKLMQNLHTSMQSRKSALKLLRISTHSQLTSPHNSFTEEVYAINMLSADSIETDARLFFEKYLLINSYKDAYISFKLKRAFDSTLDFINDEITKFGQYVSFLKAYDHVDSHPFHLPVITKTDLLLLHNISSAYFFRENVSKDIWLKKYQCFDFNILNNVSINKVPVILNSLLKFNENKQSNLECCIFDEKFFHLILDIIVHRESNDFIISHKTVKCFENLLNSSFKNMRYHFDSYLKELEDLIYHLVQDLDSMSFSISDRSQIIEKTGRMKSDLSNEVANLKSECINKQHEIDNLLALLESEKKEKDVLDRYVKDIDSNYKTATSQNENLKRKIFEVGKLYHVIKIIFSDNCTLQQLQSEFATLSDTFCLCKDCLVTENKEQNCANHDCFTPVKLVHSIAKLFTLKSDYEKEIAKLNEENDTLRQNKMALEDEVSSLSNSFYDAKKFIYFKEQEMQILEEKIENKSQKYYNLECELSEMSVKKEDQQKAIDDLSNSLIICRQQYEEILNENQQFKDSLVEKEQKIAQCEIIIKEKESECESITIKYNQNETKLKDLNSMVETLNSALNEAKSKVATLEKSNNLLNVTLESVEEELQNIYSEKQEVERNLQLKSDEIETLHQKLTSWKSKATGEESEISCLQTSLEELQATIQELQNKNMKLQNDFAQCKNAEKEYKKSILEKNFSIQKKSDEIETLRQELNSWKSKVVDEEKEFSCLQTSVKELQATIQELQNQNLKLQNDFAQCKNAENECKKSILEKNLSIQKKSDEIDKLRQEIMSWKSKATGEGTEISCLQNSIKELQTTIQELQNKNVQIENNFAQAKIVEKDYKKSLLEKNFSIQQKELTIKELKKTLSESITEKQNLEAKVESLSNELQELENKLDKAIVDNEKLEKEISNLQLLKSEKENLLQDMKEMKIKCEEFIQENESLKSELEKLILEKENHEKNTISLIDKISDLEKELKKAHSSTEDITREKKELERELESSRKTMKFKSSESSLLVQGLQQKLDELTRKNVEKDQIAEMKINDLILQKDSLLKEINSLKLQSKVLELNDNESKVNYKNFIAKLIDLLRKLISKFESNSDFDQIKTLLLSDLSNWENKISSESFFNEIQQRLESVFNTLIDKQKEMERNLSDVKSIASSYVTEISQLCQIADIKHKPNLNSTELFNKSCFDVTLCNNITLSSEDLESVTSELSEGCSMLKSHFTSMNGALLKKEMEINSLKEALLKNELKMNSLKETLEKAKTSAVGCTSCEKQNLIFENKYKLISTNCRRLEKKHLKLLQTNEEMEKRIKALEEEKVELEAEAEEMAAIIRQHDSSDEQREMNEMLSKCSKELREAKRENESLKAALRKCETLYAEMSINITKLSEFGESSQNNV